MEYVDRAQSISSTKSITLCRPPLSVKSANDARSKVAEQDVCERLVLRGQGRLDLLKCTVATKYCATYAQVVFVRHPEGREEARPTMHDKPLRHLERRRAIRVVIAIPIPQ